MIMNWIHLNSLQLSSLQLHWVHEISQSALAIAVATLGVVILLELASISRLRRSMDAHLQRVFEQLDLLRGDSQQLFDGQSQPVPAARPAAASAPNPVSHAPVPLAAGEARLLAALTAARARMGRTEGSASH
jgi:hypothetical protein